MSELNSKTCLECGEKIKGRVDKKFCNDWCRNAYNNKLNSDNTSYVRNVNNILRRNRRIIQELIPASEKTFKTSRSKLHQRGFNFMYFTNTFTNQKGVVYYYCYDYGYSTGENEFILLVKRNESAGH